MEVQEDTTISQQECDAAKEHVIPIAICPRCRQYHPNIVFKKLKHPAVITGLAPYTMWAFCWVTQEPILGRLVGPEEVESLMADRRFGEDE
jgi:hypothetical protein